MSHYKHLSIEERESLYLSKNQGKSIREIARELGRSPSTISRELARNRLSHRPYSPSRAQHRYEVRKKNCGRKPVLSAAENRRLIQKLIGEYEWSPEQIQNRLLYEGNVLQISYSTIYRALKNGLLDDGPGRYIRKCDRYSFHLRRQGKPRKKNGTINKQGKYHIEYTISQRPAAANARTEIGHWEGDTVAGKKGGARLLTQVDRKTRYLLAVKVPNASSEAVRDTMILMFSRLPESKVRSITPDRGQEFAKHAEVSAALHDVPFYFADPYSPWQRGSNENTNGLLRQYFPKYTSLDGVSDSELDAVVAKLNLRPRKCLNWRTPFELFFDSPLHLT